MRYKDNNRRIGKAIDEAEEGKEFKSSKQKELEHIEIAKRLFQCWDADGGGSLAPDEIMKAFIQMGLS